MQPPKEQRRRSTRSLRATRVASPPPALTPAKAEKPTEPCEIDPEMQLRILSLEALAHTADHYTLLGVARDADKKDIKRAYCALASKMHPDRFFGKKLGHIRTPLDRLFIRLTEANDDASTAERAANALRVSNGDLRLAATLAEQAVNADEKNLEYRITLGEVHLAAGFVVRAAAEVETALRQAPQNPRARFLDARVKAKS